MATILSGVLLGIGLAIVIRTMMKPALRDPEFPRFGGRTRWDPRILSVIVGLGMAGAGAVLLLLSLRPAPGETLP